MQIIYASVTLVFFVLIFIKCSPKCRTKKLGMIYTILGSFCSFFNWEGADIRPQARHSKIPVCTVTITSRGARDSKIGKKWPESSRILDYILS